MAGFIRREFSGFIHFVRTQGVVGFAVGFILGKAMSDLVGSIVNDIIDPLIGIPLSHFKDLSQVSVTIGGATVKYGNTISILINFVVLALVVYFVIKKAADVFDRPKNEQFMPEGKEGEKVSKDKDDKKKA